MTALELATADYWRASQAALAGSMVAARKLMVISAYRSDDISRLADAACNSLSAAAMRVAQRGVQAEEAA